MGQLSITLTDVGEGVAEAELIEWRVAVGETVAEDQVLGVVMTDKAAVEIPSSVLGKVITLAAKPGDMVAVGAELVRLEIDGVGTVVEQADSQDESPAKLSDELLTRSPQRPVALQEYETSDAPNVDTTATDATRQNATSSTSPETTTKPLAAPSVRRRAKDAGVELNSIIGTGPAGRITHDDLERFLTEHADAKEQTQAGVSTTGPNTFIEHIKLVGMRRMIAQKMALSKSRIPHITIVEEVDVSNVEELRVELNDSHAQSRTRLTFLPFLMKAIVEAVNDQPQINAHFDDEQEIITQYGGVHIGIATQTPNGLVVPVVKHCEVNNLWANAAEISRLSIASRDGKATRDDLSGSTITISSLGSLGAVATTPIINHPEVAIVGVNKMMTRPVWDGQQFQPRMMMNLSCSFDHRVIDGWDAAVFVQKVKQLLENPAMLFVEA